MVQKLTDTDDIKKFLKIVSGMTAEKGNPRAKKNCPSHPYGSL